MLTVLSFILFVASILYFFTIYKKYKQNQSVLNDATQGGNFSNKMEIQNVRTGGVIHLRHVGSELEDYDVNIIGRHIYDQEGYKWIELEGETASKKVWIEIEDDNELEITIKLDDFPLREVGLSKSDLDRIDDEEDGQLTYKGEVYYYEDSDEAVFLKNGNEETSEVFYYWDFENNAGDKYISVENWGGEYQVSLSVPLKESQIDVYSLTG